MVASGLGIKKTKFEANSLRDAGEGVGTGLLALPNVCSASTLLAGVLFEDEAPIL